MEKHFVLLSATITLSLCAAIGEKSEKTVTHNLNLTNSKNDTNTKNMNVTNATVYEVGHLANSSSKNGTRNTTQTSPQESVTVHNKNGSNLNLSNVPQPTNATSQRVVGVTPAIRKTRSVRQSDDSAALDDTPYNYDMQYSNSDEFSERRTRQAHQESDEFQQDGSSNEESNEQFANEQLDSPRETYAPWFVRDKNQKGSDEDRTTKVVHGTSVIPQEATVSSIGLPSVVISTNKVLTTLPVPVPNTSSVVQYSKATTMVTPTNKSKTSQKS